MTRSSCSPRTPATNKRARSTLEVSMHGIVRRLSTMGLVLVAGVSAEAQGQPVPRRPLPPVAQVRPGAALRRERIAERRIDRRVDRRLERRAELRGIAHPRAVRATRERMIARRAVARERVRTMTPAQRQQLAAAREALRVERQRIGEQLRSGSITREQGRQRMLNWRREHRPNLGLRSPRRPGEGDF